jgi:Kef-type K+ transport system membrane component KefB
MMPMVKDKQLNGPEVLLTKTWVLIADAITIVTLPLALAPDRLEQVGIGSAVIAVLAVASFFGLKWFRSSRVGDYYRERSKLMFQALDLKQSLTILFGLAFVAYQFKISFLVPGFAAGAVVALIGEPRRFTKQLVGLAEGLFVPIFFVTLAAELDFKDLFQSLPNMELVGMIAGATVIVHVAVALLVRLPVASGLAASSQLGLPAAVASLGLANGMLTSVQAAAVIAASMVSVLVCTAGTMMLQKYSVAPAQPVADEHTDHAGHDHK